MRKSPLGLQDAKPSSSTAKRSKAMASPNLTPPGGTTQHKGVLNTSFTSTDRIAPPRVVLTKETPAQGQEGSYAISNAQLAESMRLRQYVQRGTIRLASSSSKIRSLKPCMTFQPLASAGAWA